MFKNLLIFIVGAGAGASISYFVLKDRIRKEEAVKAQEEINKMKKDIREREKAADRRVNELENALKEKQEEELKIKLPEVPGFSKDRDYGFADAAISDRDSYKNVINYSGYSKPESSEQKEMVSIHKIKKGKLKEKSMDDALAEYYEDEELDDEADDDPHGIGSYSDHPKEGLAEKPYKITDSDFRNTCPFHSKETLFYYPDRDILCDEEDTPLGPEEYGLVGTENLTEFKDGRIFVRNERAAADYEIVEVKEFDD